MKKKAIFFCLKAVAAMVAAFVLLNLFCVFYYNVPANQPSRTHATDYVWPGNKFYSRGNEGFAWGVTDKNGFNNLKTFEDGEIDILVIGSSHMEAFNVAQDKNTTVHLNNMFQASGLDLSAYNIGISGHTLERCLNNLGNAVDEFDPQKYVVIETMSLVPDAENVKSALDGTLEPMLSSNHKWFVGKLKQSPYLGLMYPRVTKAIGNLIGNHDAKEKTADAKNTDTENEQNQMLDALLSRCAKACETAGVELIIFYNCEIEIDDRGQVLAQSDTDTIENFKALCEKNHITFVNMYDAFKENYDKTNKLPRGFSNTKVGAGHLNEAGHRVVAETLFSVMSK